MASLLLTSRVQIAEEENPSLDKEYKREMQLGSGIFFFFVCIFIIICYHKKKERQKSNGYIFILLYLLLLLLFSRKYKLFD